jgi:hypothetical protein
MESPIEVVRRFCAAWSDNIGAAELAAFFTDDAVYHNIPLAPVTGREAIAQLGRADHEYPSAPRAPSRFGDALHILWVAQFGKIIDRQCWAVSAASAPEHVSAESALKPPCVSCSASCWALAPWLSMTSVGAKFPPVVLE